jgi:hypothetical protein
VLAVHQLVKREVLAAVEFLTHRLVVLAIHHQQVRHKVALVALGVVLAISMVLVGVEVLLLLALMEQLLVAAMVALVRHQAFQAHPLPMRVAVAAARFLAHHLHLAALAGAVEARQTLMELLAQQTLAVAVVAQILPMTLHSTMAALAVPALLSSS